MAAPTYRVYNITANSFYISVSNPSAYYIRIICRRADSTNAPVDEWVGNGTTYTGQIVGLDPETDYVVNVGYNETGDGGATFVGSTTVTTEAEEEEPEPVSGGTTHLYISGTGWKPYAPHIYIAGRSWRPHAPYVYISGTGWKPY